MTATARTVFLDTNALVKLFQFWEACKVADVSMDVPQDWMELRDSLTCARIQFVESLERADFQPIDEGLRCFRVLFDARAAYEFFSCRVSQAEMHRTVLEANAEESLARGRVPLSLRRKRPLLIHRHALQDIDYTRVNDELSEFSDVLRHDFHIDIRLVEDDSHGASVPTDEIFLTAEAIWSRILMETIDAYIYAAAIACEADFFLTGDSALRSTAQDLSNPPTGEWRAVSEALRDVLGKPDTFRFPNGHRLVDSLPPAC